MENNEGFLNHLISNDGSNESLDKYKAEFVTPPLKYGDMELLLGHHITFCFISSIKL